MTTSQAHVTAHNRQRRRAVQLRLDGLKLSDISSQVKLSAPTIIAAYKAYLSGGWDAVDVRARGRQPGVGSLPDERQPQLSQDLQAALPESVNSDARLWSYSLANRWLQKQGHKLNDRAAAGYFQRWGFTTANALETLKASNDPAQVQWLNTRYAELLQQARHNHATIIWAEVGNSAQRCFFSAHTLRKKFYWLSTPRPLTVQKCIDFLNRLQSEIRGHIVVILRGIDMSRTSELQQWLEQHSDSITCVMNAGKMPGDTHHEHNSNSHNSNVKSKPNTEMHMTAQTTQQPGRQTRTETSSPVKLTHLQRLEAESIHIVREVMAEADNPVMLYSVGKDSAVLMHLAIKAAYPAKPLFPLLHVDTMWKFRAMYEFRDRVTKELGMELLTHVNADGVAQGVNPFTHGSGIHTDIMKTESLKQALDKHKFDVAFAGARRDEEKSRSKERIFSFRSAQYRWEPKEQRPELWRQYNTRKRVGESIRVFPLSNWTEFDIWQYIHLENIPIVPLYLAAERPVVERDGRLIMVDDERMPLREGEVPMMRKVRFRTLGCYPLTGAIESNATSVPEVIEEMRLSRTSERQGRIIDHDAAASMEKKKQEGYF